MRNFTFITQEEIKSLARLAKLSFTDEELQSFSSEFVEIIAFADEINGQIEGDTDSIREVAERAVALNDLRADEVCESLPEEKVTANALSENGYFSVRRVVK